jgi:hypothetical protein
VFDLRPSRDSNSGHPRSQVPAERRGQVSFRARQYLKLTSSKLGRPNHSTLQLESMTQNYNCVCVDSHSFVSYVSFLLRGPPNGGVAVRGMFEVLPKAKPVLSPVPIPKRPSHVCVSLSTCLTMEKNVNMIEKMWGRVLFPAAAHYFC